eukprot:TRINITY_DN63253_c0_g1_i1.p1 TRINITY_DN63253_c0_g1~~TRINITY_DN63253_c0_g1_i1.p1  ORF type:complete len:348 (-),score=39.80 TRINITY_DN63253_c0_g1_i1:176-1219(-)
MIGEGDRPFEAIVGRGQFSGWLSKAKQGKMKTAIGQKTTNKFVLNFDSHQLWWSKESDETVVSDSYNFSDIYSADIIEGRCFSLVLTARSLQLYADTPGNALSWVAALRSAKSWAEKSDPTSFAEPQMQEGGAVSQDKEPAPASKWGVASTLMSSAKQKVKIMAAFPLKSPRSPMESDEEGNVEAVDANPFSSTPSSSADNPSSSGGNAFARADLMQPPKFTGGDDNRDDQKVPLYSDGFTFAPTTPAQPPAFAGAGDVRSGPRQNHGSAFAHAVSAPPVQPVQPVQFTGGRDFQESRKAEKFANVADPGYARPVHAFEVASSSARDVTHHAATTCAERCTNACRMM